MLEANISDIDIELDDRHSDKSSDIYDEPNKNQMVSVYVLKNFTDDSAEVPEVPFVHWSIYR